MMITIMALAGAKPIWSSTRLACNTAGSEESRDAVQAIPTKAIPFNLITNIYTYEMRTQVKRNQLYYLIYH